MVRILSIMILLAVTSCSHYTLCVVTEKENDGLYMEVNPLGNSNHTIYPHAEWVTADQIWLGDTIWIHDKTLEVKKSKDGMVIQYHKK